jgi:HMG (high mobility group) box
MSAQEKEGWDKKAQKDKARYEVEKAMYKGPWKVPANKRTPKDPAAPKRPMSAFLAFSNKRRAALKREHPDATNADLSKMLSISWKEAPDDIRSKYMEEEAGLRSTYKCEMGKWRKKVAEEKKVERQEREAIAMEAAETGHVPTEPPAPMPVPAPEPRRYTKNSSAAGTSASSSHTTSHHPDEPPPGYHHHHHHQPPPPPQDSSSGPMGPGGPPGPGSMYGNPYGGGEYGYGGMPPNPGPGGYPPMMGGQPYGSQHYMGGHSQQPYMPPPYMSKFS